MAQKEHSYSQVKRSTSTSQKACKSALCFSPSVPFFLSMAHRLRPNHPFFFFFFIFLSFFNSISSSHCYPTADQDDFYALGLRSHPRPATTAAATSSYDQRCDLSVGKWVYDESYPLYDSTHCPYLSARESCQANGRPDDAYQKWRWQPNACSIPRYLSYY